ncbi:glutaredoxin 2 [Acidothermus cellulolyticus 11B]|uniref:Glutaredoxin 2 n=1 Tax=Acidothermus cellulolyticus (strain ATCC 43068 / DSM 8971 / 11B) TaxID=351607 RepID=A0LRF5_ACIC1|nr:glutaredoxin family protein [Acidothermus cellulolyticus]ABK52015.1 glutaredoxin 2 [Acidothermus cellulolyticus 11B]MBX5448344.1 glutaredoxin family protein [Acidothermus cellulolyticus]
MTVGASAAGTPHVVLLSKPGCHLCDEARVIVAAITAEFGIGFVERDIRADPEDLREYGELIPVVLVNDIEVGHWRITADQLRAALRAGSSRPA